MATRRLRPVYLVYKRSSKYLGSTIMRAFQLSRLAARHAGEGYAFRPLPIPGMRQVWRQHLWVRMRGPGLYIFVKDAIDRLAPEPLAALRRRSSGILVDYVDRSLEDIRLDSVDVHIASSLAGLAGLERLLEARRSAAAEGARARFLIHNVDERFVGLPPPPQDRLRLVYFGGPGNTRFSPQATTMVDLVSAELAKDAEANYRRLSAYNAHYCVRPGSAPAGEARIYKPFTKGFTAAALGAPVLVNRQVDDAVAFLGEDYPYLVADDGDGAIDAGLARMAADFGTPAWTGALETMARLRDRVSPEAIARDLRSILDEFG